MGTWIVAILSALAALWLAAAPAPAGTEAAPWLDASSVADDVERLAPRMPAPAQRAAASAQAADETGDPDDEAAPARARPTAAPDPTARGRASVATSGRARPRAFRPSTGPPLA